MQFVPTIVDPKKPFDKPKHVGSCVGERNVVSGIAFLGGCTLNASVGKKMLKAAFTGEWGFIVVGLPTHRIYTRDSLAGGGALLPQDHVSTSLGTFNNREFQLHIDVRKKKTCSRT